MQKSFRFVLNNEIVEYTGNQELPLLDYLRYKKDLKGTKIGCREGDCGACTVLIGQLQDEIIEYRTVTSCLVPMFNIQGKHVVTIEGLQVNGINKLQKAYVEENASQCGFCTPGFIVSTASYVLNFTLQGQDPKSHIAGNICRCTGYYSIIRAMNKISSELSSFSKDSSLSELIELGYIPAYFEEVKEKLEQIQDNNLVHLEDVDKNSLVVGGATDLYVHRSSIDQEKLVLPLKQVHELNFIEIELDQETAHISLGSAVTFSQLADNDVLKYIIPKIDEYFSLIASIQIRNEGTLGGNIVNASPIADLVIFLLPFDPILNIRLIDGSTRQIQLASFYKDYKVLDLKPGEIVYSLDFSLPKNAVINFEKVSKRTYLDIASVNSGFYLLMDGEKIQECRISLGGVAPVPKLLTKTSEFLRNQMVSPEIIEQAVDIALTEISPISDIRGSAEYKRLLAKQLIKAHFIETGILKFEEVLA